MAVVYMRVQSEMLASFHDKRGSSYELGIVSQLGQTYLRIFK